jgi:hypothetical protein
LTQITKSLEDDAVMVGTSAGELQLLEVELRGKILQVAELLEALGKYDGKKLQ